MRLIDADAFDKCLSGAEIEATKSRKYVFSSAINTIRGNLANFPTVNQWIPCSERLPEKGLRVLMQLNNAWQLVGWYDKEDKQWYALPFSQEVVNDCVLAWMPLPDAYEEDD